MALSDDFSDDNEAPYVAYAVEERKDRSSFVAMLGAQGQLGRISPFAQVTYQPSQIGFLLNGRPAYFLEGGIRINIGSAIERFE